MSEGKVHLERMHRRGDSEDVKLIELAQDTVQWRDFLMKIADASGSTMGNFSC
jgi:hypothetical protein